MNNKTTTAYASMRNGWAMICIALFAAMATLSTSALGQTVSIQTNRDTTLTPYAPNSNTGSLDTIYLNDGRWGLIGFDIPATPPGQQIVSATLHLCAFQGSGEISIYDAGFAWNESTATWNTHVADLPQVGVDSPVAQGALATQWNSYIVTSLVQEWANGATPNHGFGVFSTGADQNGKLASREFTGGSQPEAARLDIEFATAPEPSSTLLLGLGGMALILRRRK